MGDSGSLQVVCEDTTIAELAVLTTRPPKGFELADFTVVEIRDLYELYNYTSSPIAFQPAPPGVPAPSGSQKQPSEATVTIIQPGSMAVLRWHSQSREFILRPCEAAEANCSRFSMPDSKHPLVPQPRSKTTDRPTDRPQLPCYSRRASSHSHPPPLNPIGHITHPRHHPPHLKRATASLSTLNTSRTS